MDILGHMFSLVLDGKLFLAPIGDHPQRILDLGCGTGLWAIEMGDLFPSAQVKIGSVLFRREMSWTTNVNRLLATT